MNFVQVVAGLCALYVGIVLIALAWDVVKLPWSMFRGKPVKFSSADYLKDRRDWTEALIFAAIFVVGLVALFTLGQGSSENLYTAEELDQAYEDGYNYAIRDYIDCPYCGEGFPERLAFETYDGDTICPDCIRDDFDDMLKGEILRCSDCGNFYDPADSYGIGLCFDCAEHVVVECNNCKTPTYLWPGQDGFAICPNCMGELMNDKSISRAINNWFE